MLQITPSERRALELLAKGKTNHEIANHLQVSERDFESSLTVLFARMGVASRTEAIAAAVRRGLLASAAPARA